MLPIIDIEDLGLDAGAHLLVKHGLAEVPPGAAVEVVGSCPGWEAQLSAWCRGQGHRCEVSERNIADEARHIDVFTQRLRMKGREPASRLEAEPEFRTRLSNAVQSRNDALSGTSGLNEEVFDALILLAAGEFTPTAIAAGYLRVQELMRDMAEGRQSRLERLGFGAEAAQRLSALHTRNFM